MELNTARLKIIPLNLPQFKLLLDGTEKMEVALKLKASNQKLDEHTQQAMESLYQEARQHPESYLWYTNWQIVLKSENISIGSASFKGIPNNKGEVELGYGINSSYRNKGYMTEAAKSLCLWALNQPDVKTLMAETEKGNIPSHKVLQRCGMKRYLETESSYFWHMQVQG